MTEAQVVEDMTTVAVVEEVLRPVSDVSVNYVDDVLVIAP